MIKALSVSLFSVVFAYLMLWPVEVDPISWQPPKDLGYTVDFAQNQQLSQVQRIEISQDPLAVGPEDYALDHNGDLYFSLENGDIQVLKSQGGIALFVNTGGRPLGIEFDTQGNLWVADAYLGLLKITADKTITTIVSEVEGVPVNYADDVDIAKNGKVYFSDASTKFHAKKYGTFAASLLDINEHGGHGRVIEFDPNTGQTKQIMQGLNFANGVAVSHDQKWLMVNETGSYRILKVGITPETVNQQSVVIDNLPGFPDNINRGSNGLYWFGMVSPRSSSLDMLAQWAFLRKVVQRMPEFMRPQAQRFGHVAAINDGGQVIHNLQDPLGMYGSTTGAIEVGESLYISSLHEPVLAKSANINSPLKTADLAP